MMIAAGTEATDHPMVWAASLRMKALSTRNDDPGTAHVRLTSDCDGFIVGEGAGILIMVIAGTTPKSAMLRSSRDCGLRNVRRCYHITQP